MIDYIETKQLVLTTLAQKLNYDIQDNRANILQEIVAKNNNYESKIINSSNKLNDAIQKLAKFISNNNIQINPINEKIDTLKKRIIGYKAVEKSLIDAIGNRNDEDIEDALIGFNSITIKFSQDINKIIQLSDDALSENIINLKKVNEDSEKDILYSLVLAVFLIIFSIYKLILLHNNIKKELNRAEAAEAEQRVLQEKLIEYNNNLEEEISQKVEEIHQQLYTHSISGLQNRNKLLEDIYKYKFKQLALFNIDKFQKFNDIYGESLGNTAIYMTAKFLTKQIDDKDVFLYHISGDEFVYAVKNSNDSYNSYFVKEIEQILYNYTKEKFTYKDKSFNLMMSAGIDFSGEEKTLAYADMALKEAKRTNQQISIFSKDKRIEKIHQEDIDCHKKLLHAFEVNGIASFFQPITPIQDSTLPVKYESLVRIVQDDGTIITPVSFIDVAKQNRMYYKITKVVTEHTLQTIEKYKIPCSMNISIQDIDNERTLTWLYNKFENFDYNTLLTIELLETEDFKNYQSVYDFCIKIRSYGITIALDDFGSGYANFTHILKLPIDYIKIDASLISNIDRNQQSKIMVETIVGLAKKLQVKTIAEFVSSKEILKVVKDLGVDYAQGFYLGKPEPIEKHLKTPHL